MRPNWSAIGQGFVGAILAAIIGLLAQHAYTDHLLLHEVIAFLNKQAQAQAPAQAGAKP